MKQSCIGSKFVNFEHDSKLSQRVFPSNLCDKPHLKKYVSDFHTDVVEIVVLQVESQIVGDKLYYLVEYIEKE